MMGKARLEELVGLLEERLGVIADAELRERDPEAQLTRLREVSEAILAFHERHRASVPPRLNHFLENCSFEKAREWSLAELGKATEA